MFVNLDLKATKIESAPYIDFVYILLHFITKCKSHSTIFFFQIIQQFAI